MMIMSVVYFGFDYKSHNVTVNKFHESADTFVPISILPKCLASDYWLVNAIKNYLYSYDQYREYDPVLKTHCLLKSSIFVNTIDDKHVTTDITIGPATVILNKIEHVRLDSFYNKIYNNDYVLFDLQNRTTVSIYIPPHEYDDVAYPHNGLLLYSFLEETNGKVIVLIFSGESILLYSIDLELVKNYKTKHTEIIMNILQMYCYKYIYCQQVYKF